LPVVNRRGVRHRKFALSVTRQERVRGGDSRPGVFVGAQEPDGVGGEAGGFGGSGDLDRCICGLRREENVFGSVLEFGEEFVPGDAAAIKAEGGCGVERLGPAALRLEV